ncbi:uncharacterized protein FOMMEDRAFT_150335 [Fomitiporia mediterranea MF3/22]|uniref:uncharacterized protein n=1 Tax=Fomitiporia mediterranea (strain MF3/22) TaxID=694068 RepID=UPI0004409097|nr:uncharacterized protein FOMMEDRAFT_150335 [Fomitiporia mediterranea MF3/22]EJD07785.1 hypothetical protein FOMMEDRAFT_150335 [Fomitiporia mediterranea MF3/22]
MTQQRTPTKKVSRQSERSKGQEEDHGDKIQEWNDTRIGRDDPSSAGEATAVRERQPRREEWRKKYIDWRSGIRVEGGADRCCIAQQIKLPNAYRIYERYLSSKKKVKEPKRDLAQTSVSIEAMEKVMNECIGKRFSKRRKGRFGVVCSVVDAMRCDGKQLLKNFELCCVIPINMLKRDLAA